MPTLVQMLARVGKLVTLAVGDGSGHDRTQHERRQQHPRRHSMLLK
jgi:hypothetical protein